MAIATLDQYASAAKQRQQIHKSSLSSTVGDWSDGWAGAGFPAPASIDPGNTTSGVVPTNATTGAMKIFPFSGIGYITAVNLGTGVNLSHVVLYDRLFHAGAFQDQNGGPGTYTLSSQPSYSSRVPGGTDYTGLQLWAEASTSFNSSAATITVTYTDQSGNTGHTTGAITVTFGGTNILGMARQLPLAAGDCGVQKIESVLVTTVGNNGSKINVMVVRPLWSGQVRLSNTSRLFPLDEIGMPQIWQDSCLNVMIKEVGAASGAADLWVEIASA